MTAYEQLILDEICAGVDPAWLSNLNLSVYVDLSGSIATVHVVFGFTRIIRHKFEADLNDPGSIEYLSDQLGGSGR